jgi:hypothetical protein
MAPRARAGAPTCAHSELVCATRCTALYSEVISESSARAQCPRAHSARAHRGSPSARAAQSCSWIFMWMFTTMDYPQWYIGIQALNYLGLVEREWRARAS